MAKSRKPKGPSKQKKRDLKTKTAVKRYLYATKEGTARSPKAKRAAEIKMRDSMPSRADNKVAGFAKRLANPVGNYRKNQRDSKAFSAGIKEFELERAEYRRQKRMGKTAAKNVKRRER